VTRVTPRSRAALAIESLTQSARERGVTLVTTLHQVDVATRFPRVLGMREGVLQFDLPSAEVTQQRLAALYAQYEHELHGPAAAVADAFTDGPRPAVMYCR